MGNEPSEEAVQFDKTVRLLNYVIDTMTSFEEAVEKIGSNAHKFDLEAMIKMELSEIESVLEEIACGICDGMIPQNLLRFQKEFRQFLHNFNLLQNEARHLIYRIFNFAIERNCEFTQIYDAYQTFLKSQTLQKHLEFWSDSLNCRPNCVTFDKRKGLIPWTNLLTSSNGFGLNAT